MRQLSGRTEADYINLFSPTVVTGRHRRRYLYLEIHQKAFVGRALPGPDGGAYDAPRTLP